MAVNRRVTYLKNKAIGGWPPVDPQTYAPGETVLILKPEGGLSREGYTFAGWNTNPDGSGTPRYPGDSVTMGGADGTLHAAWIRVSEELGGVRRGSLSLAPPTDSKEGSTPSSSSSSSRQTAS